MHVVRAFVAGVAGALVMTIVMIGLRAFGIPLHIESQLARVMGTQVWAVGFAAHLLIGGAIGIVYAAVFEFVFRQSGIGVGVLLGAMNTIFAGYVWWAIGGPGFFWHTIGPQGIIALFVVHFTYGAVVGGLYRS